MEKLSERIVWTEFEKERDKHNIKNQIFDRIIDIEDENERLVKENEQLKQNENELYELKRKLKEQDQLVETLNAKISGLKSSEYIVGLMKERDELRAEVSIQNSINKNLEKENKKLLDKVYGLEQKLECIKGCKHTKCLTCDSYIYTCKANTDLGYNYCNAKNGYVGYREVIREMD